MSRRSEARDTAPARETAPAFPIRLVALDLDGTLVGDDLLLRDRTRVAIRAAIERSVSVSIVTGRMATSALGFARDLGIRDPLVGYQGALIRAVPPPGTERLGKLLLHRPLAAAAAREAIEWTRQIGLDPHVNHLEQFVIRADDPRADDYSAFLGGRAVLVDDLLAWLRRPVSKIIAVSDGPMDESVLDVARQRFAGRADVTISHPRFLEFLRPGVSKGAAVRWLARRAGVPLANVLAIGDQFNDLEMIATAGHGAAMPHAPAPVRSAARYVAEPLDDEGAARLIEDLVLAEPSTAARHAARLARMAADARAGIEARPGSELGATA
ncbi:MAG TPA: Cof-type HAD-IIB family hydrolase [Candidatus Limnocylindrales bacterium]|nr:Cof-type HAD-IIB family hydrolase [Candidatus Limnocylindrales bacterium]